MKTVISKLDLFVRLGLTTAALMLAPQVFAAGTDAGVIVSNTAVVDYKVGGAAQPSESSTPVTFLVDRKVIFDVSRTGVGLTPINLGASGFLEFVVTNTSNDFLDFNLGAAQLAVGDGQIYPPDATTVDDDGRDTSLPTYAIGTFESSPGAGDAGAPDCSVPATKIDELPEDISVRVYLCASAPAVAINDDVAGLRLEVTATDDAGTTLVAAGGADDPAAVENVFATTSGTATESDIDGFRITASTLTVSKTSAVIGGGKAIPGAIVEYTITINNPADAPAATELSIGDDLDANVTFKDDGYGAGQNVSIDDGVNPVTYCDADGDATDNCTLAAGPPVSLTIAGKNPAGDPIDVAANSTTLIRFQVVIN